MTRHTCCLFLLASVLSMGCGGVPGDPDTIVVDGEPLAGYAWSGPGSYCCDIDGTENVGWQIWFTNTDFCPTSSTQSLALLMILSPERTHRPSTELPMLDSDIVPIQSIDGYGVTEPMAYLNSGDITSSEGTLTLTAYGTEEIIGSFTAMSRRLGGSDEIVEVHGTFHANRCGRIND